MIPLDLSIAANQDTYKDWDEYKRYNSSNHNIATNYANQPRGFLRRLNWSG